MEAIANLAGSFLGWMLPAAAKAALLLAAAGAATLGMRRASSAARYRVWVLALAGALVLPLAAAFVPAWAVRLPGTWRQERAAAATLPPLPAAAALAPIALSPEPASLAAVPPETILPSRAPQAPEPAPAGTSGPGWAFWAALAWTTGALALAGRRAVAALALRRLERAAMPAGPGWGALAEPLGRRLGLRRPVRLLLGGGAVPFTWGTLRPVVLLPAEAEGWPEPRRESVLLHELAHVRRRDALALLMVQAACALHWWNPLAWMAARRLRMEGERACDDLVLAAGRRASDYATDLLEIARRLAGTESLAGPGWGALAMARRSQLEGRLVAILDPRLRRGAPGRLAAAAALLAQLALVLPLAALRPLSWGEEVRIDDRGSRPQGTSASTPAAPRRTGTPTAPRPAAAVAPRAAGVLPPRASGALPAAAPAPGPRPAAHPAPAAPAPGPRPAAAAPAPVSSPAARPAAPAAVPASAICPPGKGNQMSWHDNDANGKKTWKASWSGSGCSVDLDAKGEIRFNDDLTDIASISSGGFFKVEVENQGVERRLKVRPGRGGLERTWTVDGGERPYDAAARAWFAALLVELDRRTGFAVDIRLPKLLRQGGPGAVLDEVSRITGDYARGVYLHALLDAARLDVPTMRRAIAQAGREVGSDYELARFLMKAAEKSPLADEASRAAFLAALDHLDSDYEHARVLLVLVGKPGLSPALARAALSSASRLGSDYELARVLVALAERRLVDGSTQLAYLDAAGKIGSDYETARALRALIESGALRPEAAEKLLRVVGGVGSAYERAGVLVAFAEAVPLDEGLRRIYIATAKGIGSSYERERALSALPGG